MQKVWILENLDCAHCADEIERAVGAIDGMIKAQVSFMSQKLTTEFAGDVEEMKKKIAAVLADVEPDVTLSE